MKDEPNPVKDILYEIINEKSEELIQKEIANKNSQVVIKELISKAHPRVLKLEGDVDENIAKLSTSLLHYLLAISLIPSQRKVILDKMDVDIVIPDLKTLSTNPKDSLIICIPELRKSESIAEQITKAETIQSVNENIWVIEEKMKGHNKKSYSISDGTISKILDDINEFLSSKKITQFKIFRV